MLIGSWTAWGATIQWTNAVGGDWNVAENWAPNQVPAGSDTAIITNAGVYTVVLNSGSATVDSLILGGNSGGQTLALEGGEFSCSGTALINPGSQLNLAESWLHTFRTEVAGTVNWQSGILDGTLVVTANGILNLTGENDKFLRDGAAITNYGLIQWSGAGGVYGQDSNFTGEPPVIVNTAGGVFEIQNDTALGSPGSFDPLLTMVFQNAGLVRKVAGPGTTTFINVNFGNSGTVEVDQGTLLFFSPNGLPPAWSSSGLFTVSAGAAVQLGAGNCTFLPGHLAQGEGSFGFNVMGS
ncbi:MAG TPA: hypothetical protein VN794_02770, partial [Methylomirabilota bacterium]|nr:hypothetical protein [Methylomirabilota bacterium]